MSTKEAPALFKARVNLVLVPVVVRDAKGRAVGTYTKENFQLFDKGKPQEITRFTVEKSGDKAAKAAQTSDNIDDGTPPPDIPERFVAYLFDDVHLQFGDLVRSRDAAGRRLKELKPTERAAIYTTSGQNQVEFTGDIDKLEESLLKLRPRSISGTSGMPQCPDVNYYMADMIANHQDQLAISAAVQELAACSPGMSAQQAANYVQNVATQVLTINTQETHVSLTVFKDVVRRMAIMPGQRVVVLISPGFITPQERDEESDVLDRAIKSNVMISTLDARGLWVDPTMDASVASGSATSNYAIIKRQYDRTSASLQGDLLAELATGTGGSFFQNNNDLDEGLRRLLVAPDFYYVLGFSPQNMKLDGSFHSLKVSLKPPANSGMDIQGRKGYYAPKKLSSAEETAKQEMEDALFSREEMHDLPVELHTQYFKGDKDATIAVLCRMDPKHIPFRKADGRNNDFLTIVSAVFDRDGNFMSGIQKTVDFKLKDDTLAKLLATGAIAIKTNFTVPLGTYMIRLVVRDSEGQLMSALNGAVAIQ